MTTMATLLKREIKRGHGSAERKLAGELWAIDTFPDHPAQETGNYDATYDRIAFDRYFDPAFAKLEFEKVWMKSWVVAAREEDIPKVGDRVSFDMGPRSFMIMRSGEDSFKAFYNSCLHRGAQLCAGKSGGDVVRCPYHAWEWNVDGSLKYIPSHWDFGMMNAENSKLREVKSDRWGGFIFINCDDDAAPLLESLSVVPRHFEMFDLKNRYTAAHFRRLVPANWKAAQEAFQESYHVVGTHPNAIPFSGDTQSQYDLYENGAGHVGRQLTPGGHPSMHADPSVTTADAIMGAVAFLKDMHFPDAAYPVLDPDQPVRPQVANWFRDLESKRLGRPCTLPDGIILDSPLYFMFPGDTLWLSESLPFFYSFVPHATDPEKSWFEVRMLKHYPEGSPRPEASERIEIGEDEWVIDKAPAFGFLAAVFDQDLQNLPLVQKGFHAADPKRAYAQLGDYQEYIVKRWHEVIDEMLAR
jgi:phenylpropionate dioxygenase-like ring-hydroxylating dioxygenase large terminal subunit